MKRTIALSLSMSMLLATTALAHDDGLTEKVRHFGIAVGKTYSCYPEEDRAVARADMEEMFDMIHHTDGNEMAFVFAVGVGYGAASEKTDTDCTELLTHVKAAKAEMGLEGTE